MIFEHAILMVEPGREQEFEAAFAAAPDVFAQAEGCHGAELRRCVETPSRYVLIVGWDTVEAHTEGFRGSPLFTAWREIVGGFFASPPEVEHYSVVS